MNKIPSIFSGFAIGLGTIIIFLLGWFVISIILCIWVYRDAKQRGEEAILWLIVVLIVNLIGVIIWLIVRPEKVEDIDTKEEKLPIVLIVELRSVLDLNIVQNVVKN